MTTTAHEQPSVCDHAHQWQPRSDEPHIAAESSSCYDGPYPGEASSLPPPDYTSHHQFHNNDHKPLLAERFKTKMCRSYERTGSCPYVHRCMFAHGDHELRNKAMNLADGLVTEEAIKYFKRMNYEAQRSAVMMYSECSSMRSTPPPPLSPYRHDPYDFVAWRAVTSKASLSSASSVSSSNAASPTARTPSPNDATSQAR
jgi:hypothetical protein